MAFDDYIEANPHGVKLAYAVRIRGLPYQWTTGEGPWTSATYTDVPGGLATRDWRFSHKVVPWKPVESGEGVSFTLVDTDRRGLLRQLFAPRYGNTTRQIAEFDGLSGSGKLYVLDNAYWSAGDPVYVGRSTYQCKTVGSDVDGEYIETEASTLYDSVPNLHVMTTPKVGATVATSPRVFHNRWVEVVCAPINDESGLIDTSEEQILWAGRIETTRQYGNRLTVSCAPLLEALETAAPFRLASGTLPGVKTDQAIYNLTEADLELRGGFLDATGGAQEFNTNPLVFEDSSGDFVQLEKGWYTLDEIAKAIVDTVVWNANTTGSAGAKTAFYTNRRLSFSVVESDGNDGKAVVYLTNNDVSISIELETVGGIINKVFTNLGNGATTGFGAFAKAKVPTLESRALEAKPGGALAQNGTAVSNMPVVLDNPNVPFSSEAYLPFTGDTVEPTKAGYVRVTQGDLRGVFKVTGVTQQGTSDVYLLDVQDVGGLVTLDFSGSMDTIRVEQAMYLDGRFGTESSWTKCATVGQMLLQVLLSDGSQDKAAGNGGIYNTLAWGHGLGIPEEYVDIDGILAAEKLAGPEQVKSWLIEGEGDLKKEIEGILKMAGLALCYRRFGTGQFGISAVPVAPVPDGQYTRQITDSSRVMGSEVFPDFNERWVVNHVQAENSANQNFGVSEVKVREYLSASIADYGEARPLKIKTGAAFSSSVGLAYNGPAEFTEVITRTALKWFGTYGGGNYGMTVLMPHRAWLYQIGDRVRVVLSDVPDPFGNTATALTGEVTRVVHNHGTQAQRCEVTLRLSYEPSYELAPCAKVTGEAAAVLTLADNEFSAADVPAVYEEHQGSTQKDVHWFDRARHGEDIGVYLWEEGDWANGVTRYISATDVAAGTVTISAASTLSTPFYMTFSTYDAAKTSSKSKDEYAWVGDNSFTIGSAADEAKVWRT